MQIFKNIDEWRSFRRSFAPDLTVGFVPTMGNLHAGHASLFKRSKEENDLSVTSLFINPTQFNQASDFNLYPRTLEEDCQLLEELGVHYCLMPSEQDMYKDGYCYRVEESKLNQLMEGKQRSGHFTGVLTVVMKLLNLMKPHNAYFGEKDYQQYLLIRDMVQAFFMDINILPCPTIREKSGLAYSSRNNRLSPEQRKMADNFAAIFHQGTHCQEIIKQLKDAKISVEYVEENYNRRFAAVQIGDVRLIDNYAIEVSK